MTIQLIIYLLFFFLLFIPFYLFFRFLYLKSKNRLKIENWWKELGIFAFSVSILMIFYVTLFPTFLMVNQKLYMTFKKGNYHQNAIPFHTIKSLFYLLSHHIYLEYAWINLLGNIILFFPSAFLAILLFPSLKPFYILLFALVFSTCIEIIQIPMQRISDIDDIILNVFGAFIGVIFALFIQWLKRQKKTNQIEKQTS